MRHRRRGRILGRSPSHRRAMLKNLASSLILTERDTEFDPNPPKVKGRVVTTLQKAKEVRPLVEKCVTIARHSLQHEEAAEEFGIEAERDTEAWKQWRKSDRWQKWCAARAPVVAARRRVLQLLGDKQAVSVLFEEIAPRFADRDGGYTRIMRLPTPRLGDAGTQAILEFVGKHDRVIVKAEKPDFGGDDGPSDDGPTDDAAAGDAAAGDAAATDEAATSDAAETAAADADSSTAESEKQD